VTAEQITVLDDGFVCLVDVMGTDADIARAARVSYGPGTRSVSEDRALIRYLMAHDHTSPFEMVELKFHIRAPLIVRNQIVRTRTANWNERSYRYSEMDDISYVPEPERIGGQSKDNKQGTGEALDEAVQQRASVILAEVEAYTHDAYDTLVELGVSRETARQATTVSRYTEWYFKIDLHNLFRFLKNRLDAHAQFETREYARALESFVSRRFPVAHESWVEYVRDAVMLSATEVAALRAVLDAPYIDSERIMIRGYAEDRGISGRQLREFVEKLS
jgi:thymidylate synthase (FAD)